LSHFHNFFDAIRANKRELLTAEINQTYFHGHHAARQYFIPSEEGIAV
jgi:hypothetical protein